MAVRAIRPLRRPVSTMEQRAAEVFAPHSERNPFVTFRKITEGLLLVGSASRRFRNTNSLSRQSRYTASRSLLPSASVGSRASSRCSCLSRRRRYAAIVAESAGKRRSTRVRHGAPWLNPVLVQGAWGAARAKRTYLQAQFYRLKARRGPKAVMAVAASILTAVYHMLKDGTFYQDLGDNHLVKRDAAATVAKLARRIKDLGYDVQYQAVA